MKTILIFALVCFVAIQAEHYGFKRNPNRGPGVPRKPNLSLAIVVPPE